MFHPLNPVNNGGTQNGSAYRKGLWKAVLAMDDRFFATIKCTEM